MGFLMRKLLALTCLFLIIPAYADLGSVLDEAAKREHWNGVYNQIISYLDGWEKSEYKDKVPTKNALDKMDNNSFKGMSDCYRLKKSNKVTASKPFSNFKDFYERYAKENEYDAASADNTPCANYIMGVSRELRKTQNHPTDGILSYIGPLMICEVDGKKHCVGQLIFNKSATVKDNIYSESKGPDKLGANEKYYQKGITFPTACPQTGSDKCPTAMKCAKDITVSGLAITEAMEIKGYEIDLKDKNYKEETMPISKCKNPARFGDEEETITQSKEGTAP